MAHVQWKDRYNINYKEIDEQHKCLVAIMNRMIDIIGQDHPTDQTKEIFHQICQYALTHFASEERYMEAAGYPGLGRHKSQHATFIDRLLELNRTSDSLDAGLLEEILVFVRRWYLNHIAISDQEIRHP
jgi:hemerythrin